jgi:hypothetical protein
MRINFHLTGTLGVMHPTACGSQSSAVVALATHNPIIDYIIFLTLQPDVKPFSCANHACSRHGIGVPIVLTVRCTGLALKAWASHVLALRIVDLAAAAPLETSS